MFEFRPVLQSCDGHFGRRVAAWSGYSCPIFVGHRTWGNRTEPAGIVAPPARGERLRLPSCGPRVLGETWLFGQRAPRRTAMDQYAGLDMALKETSISTQGMRRRHSPRRRTRPRQRCRRAGPRARRGLTPALWHAVTNQVRSTMTATSRSRGDKHVRSLLSPPHQYRSLRKRIRKTQNAS
jgi:hypothetical protein